MNCPACQRVYSHTVSEASPKVLIHCGHTFCHSCIQQHFKNQSIACFNCGTINTVPGIDKFPVNEELMSIVKRTKLNIDPHCKLHNKKIEIYCQKDHKLLCSECIIHSHQHHRMRTVTEQAQKERAVLNENLLKVKESLEQYRNDFNLVVQQERNIEHALIDCQTSVNLFFQTIYEQILRLKQKEIERLQAKKEEAKKKVTQQKEELEIQIKFLSGLVEQIYEDLTQLNDTQFLMQTDKRNFLAENCKAKKMKLTISTIQFKKSFCLQELAKSIQDMMNFQNNRNSNQISSSLLNLSPLVKKQKQPAVLEVNLREQYHKRKVSNPVQKSKPTKKTINIQPDRQKVGQAISSARNNSFQQEKPKIQSRAVRQNSMKTNRQHKQLESFLQQDDFLNLSQNFTPIASIQSFMRSSRQSESSLIDDVSFKNTFRQYSVLEGDQCVYHIGGLSHADTQKYYLQSRNSERLSAVHSQLRGRGFQFVYLKAYNSDKCLLLGGLSAQKQPTADIYEFSFKQHRVSKSTLKLAVAKYGFGCIARESELFTLGGKMKQKAQNSFQKYKISNKELVPRKMPSMQLARVEPGCCLGFDGKLYAIGGLTLSNDATNSAQRFNWQKQSWQAIKPMKFNRISFVVLSTPKGIFAIGGHTTKRFLKQVEFYDFEEQKWIDKAKMKYARSYHTAIVSKDYQTITVFGGLCQSVELDSIQIYDISKNEWRSGGAMKSKRCLHVSILSPK